MGSADTIPPSGRFNEYRNVILGVPQGSVLGPLLFILYTHDMWFGLENMLVSYADDATLLARIPSPNMRSDATESLNRDLSKICLSIYLSIYLGRFPRFWGVADNTKI